MTTEGKEKAEVLNAFFTSVFTSQTTYPQSTQPPELEGGAELGLGSPQFRWKQLETCCSTWTVTSPWDRMGSEGAEGVGGCDCQASFCHLSAVMLIQRGPR